MFKYLKNMLMSQPRESKEETKEEIIDESTKERNIRASITFFIGEDGSPFVEANIKEVEKENVVLMSELLAGIAQNQFLDSTIELVKDFLIEHGRADLFLVLAEQITALAYEGKKTKQEEEEPYIKPSDAI